MALNQFIPQVWSARLLQNLHKELVIASPTVVNTDYEGEIAKYGDTVKINNIGPVTVFDYTKNVDMTAPETLSDAQRALVVDQAKAFNFQVDDIDKAQQKPKVMDEAMREASYALRNQADTHVAGKYTEAGLTSGSDGTPFDPDPATPTGKEFYNKLVDIGVTLDENNVPADRRFVVVPPWAEGYLLKDDRFVSFGTDANRENLTNGRIGRAAGFEIVKSNNVATTGGGANFKILAGHPSAISFAGNVTEVEAYRPERRFADALKGLYVFGSKVVRPQALLVLTATRS